VCPYCKAKQSPIEAQADLPSPEKATWSGDHLGELEPDEVAKPKAKSTSDARPEQV
jgi:hypothetical protein